MDLTGGGGAWNSQPYVKPFCLSPTLQPTAQFSQRGSCVLSHSLRNSGVRLAACGLPDVARVLLACHRVNAIAHRLRAVAGTHISAARNQKNSGRPQPVRRFRGVTFAVVAHFVVARDHFRSSLLTAAARSPVVMGGVVPLPLLFARRNSVRIVRHTVPRYPRLPASAARLRVVPSVCCITTRLLPLAGSVLPTRSAFHEPGQLRRLLLTIVCPSR